MPEIKPGEDAREFKLPNPYSMRGDTEAVLLAELEAMGVVFQDAAVPSRILPAPFHPQQGVNIRWLSSNKYVVVRATFDASGNEVTPAVTDSGAYADVYIDTEDHIIRNPDAHMAMNGTNEVIPARYTGGDAQVRKTTGGVGTKVELMLSEPVFKRHAWLDINDAGNPEWGEIPT